MLGIFIHGAYADYWKYPHEGRKGAAMKARAKSSNTPHPIWVYGDYITTPPKRPSDGAVHPVGHYIDKGGYPGANVYEVDMATFCVQTGAVDRKGSGIYTQDILLYETEAEIGYFIVEDEETVIDIAYGEILPLRRLQEGDIKVIGNAVDIPDFAEGIGYYVENEMDIPYIPLLNVQVSAYPYMRLECMKCRQVILSCRYMAIHKECGGFFQAGFATKIYREKEKTLA